jgi:molecular chaperone DnaK (HSP70)
MGRTDARNPADGVGIDFGTTNSVVAVSTRSKPNPRVKALLADDSRPHPSVVWYRVGEEPRVGRLAKSHILGFSEAPGNLFIPSIKRSLGKGRTYSIFGSKVPGWQVASEIFRHLRHDAQQSHGSDISGAVVTIPVDFDGRARRDLRLAAHQAGVYIKTFVHEPFAAIVGYCYTGRGNRTIQQRDGEKILVFDWGGGTLDITIGQVEGGTVSELATSGLSDRSGDHFDDILANFAKTEFMARNLLQPDMFVLQPSTRDRLRTECELRKIDLSTEQEAMITLGGFYQLNGRHLELDEFLNRSTFEGLIDQDVSEAMARVDQVLESAGLRASDIDLALLIGGTSLIPKVRKEMFDRFGVKMVQIPNADSIIAEGASLVDALNLHPVLARPVCIELSDGSHYEVFRAGELAKTEVCTKEVALFCTDNRDGQARLIVKEGTGPFKDRYSTKCVLSIPVSPLLPQPYNHERVTARFVLDEDLVLKVSAVGAIKPEGAEAEIFDLCFALRAFEEDA